jgi:hypothetical protein
VWDWNGSSTLTWSASSNPAALAMSMMAHFELPISSSGSKQWKSVTTSGQIYL